MAPAMLALVQLTARISPRLSGGEGPAQRAWTFPTRSTMPSTFLTEGDDGAPTAAGAASRYREVMVDEYQDSNQVQNCIFRACPTGTANLFAVGDVKQSIYRFRLADPTIFLEKYLSYRPGRREEGQPERCC